MGPRATTTERKIKRETEGGKKVDGDRASRKVRRIGMAFRIVKFSGRPQEKGRNDGNGNKDGREDDADATTKDERGRDRERERERKVVSVDGRLLRPCSRSFPLNSSTSGRRGGRRRMESQDDAERTSGVGEGKRSA